MNQTQLKHWLGVHHTSHSVMAAAADAFSL